MRLFLALIISLTSLANWGENSSSIEERIKPLGQVQVDQQNSTEAELLTSQKVTAQTIYNKHCIICHQDGVAGAPKFHNKADWESRLKVKNLDQLLQSAITGLNAMPPKGTCTECSEEDLKNVIEYMLPNHD